jgi:hypothetical protein
MAGTKTYLTLVNLVLRELNEVELTSGTFATVEVYKLLLKVLLIKLLMIYTMQK